MSEMTSAMTLTEIEYTPDEAALIRECAADCGVCIEMFMRAATQSFCDSRQPESK